MNYGDAAFISAFCALIPVLGCGFALVAGVRRAQVLTVLIATAVLLVLWVFWGAAVVLGPDASPALSVYYGLVLALSAVQLSVVLPRLSAKPRAVARASAIAWTIFVVLWVGIVQFAVAGWTLNLVDGWLITGSGFLDFGGSSVLFVSTGCAVLAWLLVHRTRGPVIAVSAPRRAALTIALLWGGFFAITVGSAAAPDDTALRATANTVLAPIAALVAWAIVERIRHRRVSLNGAVRGIFAGLVAITAAADVLSPLWAAVLGLCAGALASAFAGPRGSVLGLVLTQLTASVFSLIFIGILGEGVGGLLTGSWAQLTAQLFSIAVVAAFAFSIAAVIAVIMRMMSAQSGWLGQRAAAPAK